MKDKLQSISSMVLLGIGIGIVTILVVIAWFVVYYQRTNVANTDTLEHFVAVNDAAVKAGLKEFGLEKCSILKNGDLDVGADMMMKQYVDGLRINVFKPSNTKDLDSSKTYCYLNNDFSYNAQDMLMADQPCSTTHPHFKNATFITNVFTDDKPSSILNAPINKCVLEIDPQKVTKEALQSFWGNIGETKCSDLYNPLRTANKECKAEMDKKTAKYAKELEEYRKSRDLSKSKMEEMTREADAKLAVLNKVESELRQCRADTVKTTQDIANVVGRIRALKIEIQRLNQQMYNLQKEMAAVNLDDTKSILSKDRACRNQITLYDKFVFEKLEDIRSREEYLETQMKNLNDKFNAIMKQIAESIKGSKTAYDEYTKIKIPNEEKAIEYNIKETDKEQSAWDRCEEDYKRLKPWQQLLDECKAEKLPYEGPGGLVASASNQERESRRQYMFERARKNDCLYWQSTNRSKIDEITGLVSVCNSNVDMVRDLTSGCAADTKACKDKFAELNEQLSSKGSKVDANQATIIDLTNEILKCTKKADINISWSITSIKDSEKEYVIPQPGDCPCLLTLQKQLEEAKSQLEEEKNKPTPTVIASIDCAAKATECGLVDKCPPTAAEAQKAADDAAAATEANRTRTCQCSAAPTTPYIDGSKTNGYSCVDSGDHTNFKFTLIGKNPAESVTITQPSGSPFTMCAFKSSANIVDNGKCGDQTITCTLK